MDLAVSQDKGVIPLSVKPHLGEDAGKELKSEQGRETQGVQVTFIDIGNGANGRAAQSKDSAGASSDGHIRRKGRPSLPFLSEVTSTTASSPSSDSGSGHTKRLGRPSLPFLGETRSKASNKPNLPFLNDIRNRGDIRNSGHHAGTPSSSQHRGLPFIKELTTNWYRRASRHDSKSSRNSSGFENYSTDTNSTSIQSPSDEWSELGAGASETAGGVLKKGSLTKTSKSRKENSNPGPSRNRKFRLTSEALEYKQQFSHVRVRRSYPLTAVEEVEYKESESPLVFRLVFSTYILILHAETQSEAKDWVDKITKAWSKWRVDPPPETIEEEDEPAEQDECKIEPEDICMEDDDISAFPTPPTSVTLSEEKPPLFFRLPQGPSPTGESSPHLPRPRCQSSGPAFLPRESSKDKIWRNSQRRKVTRRAFRIARLKPPRLERTDHRLVYDPERQYDSAHEDLHEDCSMIKYPSKILHIPSEKTFTIDKYNLQIMWKNRTSTHFTQKSSLSIRRVVEIRQGQQTVKFDKFPYEQVEDKSFSLLFESENNKFAKLDSLDLICEASDIYDRWMEGLKTLVSSTQWLNLFPPRYEDSDPTILWLKQIWTLKLDEEGDELKQNEAIKLAKKFLPLMSHEQAKAVVWCAHDHQLKYTLNYGAALRWDGFVLMFNILCDTTDLQLYGIYREYAKQYPMLGLTDKEFKQFLIRECYWRPEDCKPSILLSMMHNYDEHYQAVKKYSAGNKPEEYQKASKLLSFRGLLSFLRSKNNSVINLDHETPYQDMSQPLSHYFINSSHNTYLEGDQLTGTSSTDAYIRVLLQGCRCIEIDCWDDVLNVNGLTEREPIIYHGLTLTTKIPFRNVIHTINDYGFNSSIYPIVISIENHCSSTQQSKMAKIFRAIFGDRLPTVNLVEQEERNRLPSPEELQGKIILKGSFSKKTATYNRKKMKKLRSNTQQPVFDFATTVAPPVRSPLTRSQEVRRQATVEVNEATHRQVTDQHDEIDGVSKYTRKSFRRRELEGVIFRNEQGQDDQELSFTETAEDLSDLILYCRSISIKPWSWKKQKESNISEMFSFGEPTAVELSKKCSRDLLCCSERQLVRTFPKGTRFDSSNYDPMQMWSCGVQLVALNFQKPDLYMHLNQGFFRNNGGCGYVLKPFVMRREDPGGSKGAKLAPFSPDIQVPHPDVTPINLEIELMSGQRLSYWKKKSTYLTVDVMTFGIKHDNARMKQATHQNNFWPSWERGEHVLKQTILMPELCLVYFKVELEWKKLYGQNCFPVISLVPGIKFVPLRTNGGELIPESGLFVRIKKTEGEGDLESHSISPCSCRVDPSEQLPVIDGAKLLPMNADYYRAKFASKKSDEMDMEDDEEDKEEDVSIAYGRRLTCPAVLQGQGKRNGVSTSRGGGATPTLTTANGGGRMEVSVEVHLEGDEEEKEVEPGNKRKSCSIDVKGY